MKIPKTERKNSKGSRKQWTQWPSSPNKYRWSPCPCQTTSHGCRPRSAGSPSCAHRAGTASLWPEPRVCGNLADVCTCYFKVHYIQAHVPREDTALWPQAPWTEHTFIFTKWFVVFLMVLFNGKQLSDVSFS